MSTITFNMAKIKAATDTVAQQETPVVNIETPTTEVPTPTQEVPQPEAEVPQPEAPKPVEQVYTSDKLTDLKKQRQAKMLEAAAAEMDSKEQLAAFEAAIKLQGEERAEIANLKKLEQDAKDAEVRNERVKLFDDAIAAYDNVYRINDTDATNDEKNTVYDAYKAKREIVINELLAKFPKSTASKSIATGTTGNGETSEAGANRAKIVEKYKEMRAAGKTDTEIRTALQNEGFKRSTVWHAINNLKIASN